jgi:hypothetical protein
VCDFYEYTRIVAQVTQILEQSIGFTFNSGLSILDDYLDVCFIFVELTFTYYEVDLLTSQDAYLSCFTYFENQLAYFNVNYNYYVAFDTTSCIYLEVFVSDCFLSLMIRELPILRMILVVTMAISTPIAYWGLVTFNIRW